LLWFFAKSLYKLLSLIPMALNSAPAVLRAPAGMLMESTSCVCSPDVLQHQAYPWVASTPEISSMWQGFACEADQLSAGASMQLAL